MVRLIIHPLVLGALLLVTACGGGTTSNQTVDNQKSKGITGKNPYDYSQPTKKLKVAPSADTSRMMVAVRDTYLLISRSAQTLYFEDRTEGREEFWQSTIGKGKAVFVASGTRVIHHTDKNSKRMPGGQVLLRATIYDGDGKGERGTIPEADVKPAN